MEQETREKPEVTTCSDGLVPDGAEAESGERKIRIAEGLSTMPKLFFDTNRLKLYSFLNRYLRSGKLGKIVGFPFTDRVINKKVCRFTGLEFRRIDRENFFTDVFVELALTTAEGLRIWKGYIELWCGFEDAFTCTIEDFGSMEDYPEHETGIRLNPWLVPYFRNSELDTECEQIWAKRIPEALQDPAKRKGEELARSYGLSIRYLPVYNCPNTAGILFFAAGKLMVRADKKHPPEEIGIPAGTIVVNTNRIKKEYANYSIFHEIIHYEYHYLFYRLQEMGCNDMKEIRTKEITVKAKTPVTCPVHWMEKQADRGAYGLLLPAGWTRQTIAEECSKVKEYKHIGDLLDQAGRIICTRYGIANFRLRARMIQLGHIEAKGALNWLGGKIRIDPFAFDPEAWRRTEETFIIDKFAAGRLYETSEEFREVFDTGKFIWADGHIARNDPRFVRETVYGPMLTTWANAHADQCCLRFERIYQQSGIGQYVFGRMHLDVDYIAKTRFFLEDSSNQEILNEMEAEEEYKRNFPASFTEGLKQLMKKAEVSQETLAEKIGIPFRTFQLWIGKPDKQFTVNFVIKVSLALELPEWISDLLLDRAGLSLSRVKKRDLALIWIQRVMWKDGIEVANQYLKEHGFDPLAI